MPSTRLQNQLREQVLPVVPPPRGSTPELEPSDQQRAGNLGAGNEEAGTPGSWVVQGTLLFIALLALGYSYYLSTKSAFIDRLTPPAESVVHTPVLELPVANLSTERRIVKIASPTDSIGGILKSYGLPENALELLSESVPDGAQKRFQLLPNAHLILSLDREGVLTRAGIEGGEVEAVKEGGQFKVVEQLKSTAPTEHTAVGQIVTSFDAAARKAGVPQSVVDDLIDLFSDRVDFDRDFRRGDRFTLIFRYSAQTKNTDVLAAAFSVKGGELVATRYVGTDGKVRYFNERGEVIGDSFLRFPVQFSKISSTFQDDRLHPVLKIRRPHNGVDFAAPVGTPVRAVASGKVLFAGYKGAGGHTIQIKHNERYETAYLHLSRISPAVRRGATVTKGQVIGAVGATGLTSGPHLHYSFYDRGRYVDPLKIKLPVDEELGKGKKIERRYLEKVLFTLRHYQSMELEALS